jgi:hypothetical protein
VCMLVAGKLTMGANGVCATKKEVLSTMGTEIDREIEDEVEIEREVERERERVRKIERRIEREILKDSLRQRLKEMNERKSPKTCSTQRSIFAHLATDQECTPGPCGDVARA